MSEDEYKFRHPPIHTYVCAGDTCDSGHAYTHAFSHSHPTQTYTSTEINTHAHTYVCMGGMSEFVFILGHVKLFVHMSMHIQIRYGKDKLVRTSSHSRWHNCMLRTDV